MHVREAISRFSSSSGKGKIFKKADFKHSLLLNDCRIIASTATSGLWDSHRLILLGFCRRKPASRIASSFFRSRTVSVRQSRVRRAKVTHHRSKSFVGFIQWPGVNVQLVEYAPCAQTYTYLLLAVLWSRMRATPRTSFFLPFCLCVCVCAGPSDCVSTDIDFLASTFEKTESKQAAVL